MQNQPIVIIVTYPFTLKSAGIYSQHKLCHLLRTHGYDSYLLFIKGKPTLNPDWDTPIWCGSDVSKLSIAIYSELIHGNPLNATQPIYWILGKDIVPPSKKNAKGKFFYWDQAQENHLGLNILRVPPKRDNLGIRTNDVLVYRGKKRAWKPPAWQGKNYVYIDRYGKNKKSSEQFNNSLNRASAIIIAEESLVIEEAIYSGCPIIVRPGTNLPVYSRNIKSIHIQQNQNDWPNLSDLMKAIPASIDFIAQKNARVEDSFLNLTKEIDKIGSEGIPSKPPKTSLTRFQKTKIVCLRLLSSSKNLGFFGLVRLFDEAFHLRVEAIRKAVICPK
jgi:hypothetical protein